jgi:methionyl-tRNA formyltransferase
VERPVRTLFSAAALRTANLGRLAVHPSVELVGVVTAPPRPVGRRGIEAPTPVEAQAHELGLHVQARSGSAIRRDR